MVYPLKMVIFHGYVKLFVAQGDVSWMKMMKCDDFRPDFALGISSHAVHGLQCGTLPGRGPTRLMPRKMGKHRGSHGVTETSDSTKDHMTSWNIMEYHGISWTPNTSESCLTRTKVAVNLANHAAPDTNTFVRQDNLNCNGSAKQTGDSGQCLVDFRANLSVDVVSRLVEQNAGRLALFTVLHCSSLFFCALQCSSVLLRTWKTHLFGEKCLGSFYFWNSSLLSSLHWQSAVIPLIFSGLEQCVAACLCETSCYGLIEALCSKSLSVPVAMPWPCCRSHARMRPCARSRVENGWIWIRTSTICWWLSPQSLPESAESAAECSEKCLCSLYLLVDSL